jgi:hypothetical protein
MADPATTSSSSDAGDGGAAGRFSLFDLIHQYAGQPDNLRLALWYMYRVAAAMVPVHHLRPILTYLRGRGRTKGLFADLLQLPRSFDEPLRAIRDIGRHLDVEGANSVVDAHDLAFDQGGAGFAVGHGCRAREAHAFSE